MDRKVGIVFKCLDGVLGRYVLELMFVLKSDCYAVA